MSKRPVITLLTDFGEGSYVPSVKGVILAQAPDARLVDLTHAIAPGNIAVAACVLSRTDHCFPPGTIHLAVVDPGVGTVRLALIVRAGDFWYVGPDNGLFGEVIRREKRVLAWAIQDGDWMPGRVCPTFHGRDIFARVAAGLANGDAPEKYGSPVDPGNLVPSPIRPVRFTEERLTGEVIWVDRYGNLITNFERDVVEGWAAGRPYRAFVGGTWIDSRVHTFMEAEPGSLVILFGSGESLEIAVAGGDASRLLSAEEGKPVHLEIIHAR